MKPPSVYDYPVYSGQEGYVVYTGNLEGIENPIFYIYDDKITVARVQGVTEPLLFNFVNNVGVGNVLLPDGQTWIGFCQGLIAATGLTLAPAGAHSTGRLDSDDIVARVSPTL